MKRSEIRGEVAFLVNFTEGVADQDTTTARLNKMIQQAYNQEVERAKLASHRRFWQMNQDVTWLADSATYSLPTSLRGKTLIDILDTTEGEPGISLLFGESSNSVGDVSWKDKDTLQWSSTSGPSSDRTIRFTYEAAAETLLDDESTPALVPPQFHYLIAWTAAILFRMIADEQVPRDWRVEQNEMRLDFYKHVGRGRPLSSTPTVGGKGGDAATTSNSVDAFGSFNAGLTVP